jgi:hypothetical protein
VSERGNDGPAPDPDEELGALRGVAIALAASPLVAVGIVLALPPPSPWRGLVAPAALFGIVALAVGHRAYQSILGRTRASAAPRQRLSALRRATIAALAVTEAVALFGVVAFHLSREPYALVGVATHLVVAGGVWPTRARLQGVLDPTEFSGSRSPES